MNRLADYFIVVGYDHGKDKQGVSNGTIVQRFPGCDWHDAPFIDGIELFCQPQGWCLSSQRMEPRFFVCVLTDVDAGRHYCACLTFNETVTIQPSRPVDEEDETFGMFLSSDKPSIRSHATINHHSVMYAPKALVLVSRFDCFSIFRNCLGILYAIYSDNMQFELEKLVGNIIGGIQMPVSGGPAIQFSIGAGDRQCYQPPLYPTLPTTGSSVAQLFQQLGIKQCVTLFCAAMTEVKILIHSCSYWRLMEMCRALTSLMYPFKYSYVYIPVLPTMLSEVVTTPTPFIMGVHTVALETIPELLDVVVVNLDGGCLSVPESVTIPPLPLFLGDTCHTLLSHLIYPDLHVADHAFSSMQQRSPDLILDKEIRAVFLWMFAQLLQGYRNCLTLVRIHPSSVITFNKASFLGKRGLVGCPFTTRLLECMFFNVFVSERGVPWRLCDLFDEVYCSTDRLTLPAFDSDVLYCRQLALEHVKELAMRLLVNERGNEQSTDGDERMPRPTAGSHTRIHQPVFPILDETIVQRTIDQAVATNMLKPSMSTTKFSNCCIVPMGAKTASFIKDGAQLQGNSARRLEVLRNCINCIFESKISDARKSFPAVLRALRNHSARLVLCHELSHHVVGTRAVLDSEQFDLVVRLLNCALQDDSSLDEYGVAAAILPLASTFCRKLSTGVMQFAFTCLQDHMVWQNLQFWQSAYYTDVQRDVCKLYSSSVDGTCGVTNGCGSRVEPMYESSISGGSSTDSSSALEMAAEQLRLAPHIDKVKRIELENAEESTVFSQAIHYANRIVYFRVPLDIVCNKSHQLSVPDRETNSASMTASVAETDSMTVESGFDEQEFGSAGQEVIKFVSRFVDQVCTDSQVSVPHVRQLHQMIPGIVAMHIETIDAVSRESKRLPPIKRPKILTPTLLSGEEMCTEPLRVFLLPDGRDEMTGQMGGPALLPAEGALFVTNYRIIFKGCPCDAYASEIPIVRCFPVSTLVKEKRISVNYLVHFDQWLHDGLQIRSNTFQLLKVAFDGEVGGEHIEKLRKVMQRLRAPPTVMGIFAFRGQQFVSTRASVKDKEKQASIRGLAKKTLLRTARKAGIKTKSSKHHSFLLDLDTSFSDQALPWRDGGSLESLDAEIQELNTVSGDTESISSGVSNRNLVTPVVAAAEAVSTERLLSRSYYSDWCRMGIGRFSVSSGSSGRMDSATSAFSLSGTLPSTLQRTESFTVSLCNSTYVVCRSYPALLPMPSTVHDSTVAKVARCYRHNRLPVVTWRHPSTNATLLRGAGFCGKGVRGIILAHQSSGSSNDTSAFLEQERYITSVAGTSCSSSSKLIGDSSLSINSLVLLAASGGCDEKSRDSTRSSHSSTAQKSSRPSNPASTALNNAFNSLRKNSEPGSGARLVTMGRNSNKMFGRLPSCMTLDPHGGRTRGTLSSFPVNQDINVPLPDCEPSTAKRAHNAENVNTFRKASLYIFTDKSHSKMDTFPNTEIVPIEFADVKHVKTSFKKLLRACVPSSLVQDGGQTFLRSIEASEWLPQLQSIMQTAGATVDLIDVQASSVVLCLEDGWDFTAQVSSVAQICLDRYYRTMEGFRVLVEKEWLSFGHRFSHRSNMTNHSIASGFAPIFLQFIDVVHQIQSQFPLSFEFNEYYLRLLAYHTVSGRFRDFLLDSELERVETGLMAHQDGRRMARRSGGSDGTYSFEGKIASSNSSRTQWFDGCLPEVDEDALSIDSMNSTGRGTAASAVSGSTYGGSKLSANILPPPKQLQPRGCGPQPHQSGHSLLQSGHVQSVFDYIDRHAARSALFYNVHYLSTSSAAVSDLSPAVLRPCFSLSALRTWRFYCHETLATGASFDLEAVALDDRRRREESEESGVDQQVGSSRRSVTAGYDSGYLSQDQCSVLLEDYRKLQLELGNLAERWRAVWLKQDDLNNFGVNLRAVSLHVRLMRNRCRHAHKRSTIQLILRGSGTSSGGLSNGGVLCGTAGAASSISSVDPFLSLHRFEKCNYAAPTHCDHCHQVLWGLVKNGVRCADCGVNVHDKCADHVHANCSKPRPVSQSGSVSAWIGSDRHKPSQDQPHPSAAAVLQNSNRSSSERVSSDPRLPEQAISPQHQPSGQQPDPRQSHGHHDQSIFHHFPSSSSEHRTLEGYLYKRGVLLKSWKQRWFVLDSVKHELRYYDGMEDHHCKGCITLADVVSVCSVSSMPGAPKRVDEKSFFELKTVRRVYNFCANDCQSAQEWVEKIQSCLQ